VAQRNAGVYRIREFAALAGVTVRALHHYDQLGLLKPSGRSTSGYRLYRDCDLARLEQIVVLKFLGLPLKEIAGLLKRQSPLPDTLRRQQQVLTRNVVSSTWPSTRSNRPSDRPARRADPTGIFSRRS